MVVQPTPSGTSLLGLGLGLVLIARTPPASAEDQLCLLPSGGAGAPQRNLHHPRGHGVNLGRAALRSHPTDGNLACRCLDGPPASQSPTLLGSVQTSLQLCTQQRGHLCVVTAVLSLSHRTRGVFNHSLRVDEEGTWLKRPTACALARCPALAWAWLRSPCCPVLPQVGVSRMVLAARLWFGMVCGWQSGAGQSRDHGPSF